MTSERDSSGRRNKLLFTALGLAIAGSIFLTGRLARDYSQSKEIGDSSLEIAFTTIFIVAAVFLLFLFLLHVGPMIRRARVSRINPGSILFTGSWTGSFVASVNQIKPGSLPRFFETFEVVITPSGIGFWLGNVRIREVAFLERAQLSSATAGVERVGTRRDAVVELSVASPDGAAVIGLALSSSPLRRGKAARGDIDSAIAALSVDRGV